MNGVAAGLALIQFGMLRGKRCCYVQGIQVIGTVHYISTVHCRTGTVHYRFTVHHSASVMNGGNGPALDGKLLVQIKTEQCEEGEVKHGGFSE